MENSLKMLTIAAGIFITCVIISFSILVMHEGMSLGSAFVNSLNEKEKDYREHNIAKYDSEILTGAEVINIPAAIVSILSEFSKFPPYL